MDVRFYLSLFLRRLHWFLLVAVAVAAGGIYVAFSLPTVYMASATLVVQSGQIPDSLAASTVQTQVSEQLQIIRQRILTRETLIDLAKRMQIYASLPDQQATTVTDEKIVLDLRKRIQIDTTADTGQATLMTIGFSGPTAEMAAAVTNELVALIVKTDVELRTGAARQTLNFFKQEVERLNLDLAGRGDAIRSFTEANKDALPDSLEFRRSQQIAAQTRLAQLDLTEVDLNTRRSKLVRLHEVTLGNGAIAPPGKAKTAYDLQLSDMDVQLGQLAAQRGQTESELVVLQVSLEATPENVITLAGLQRDYDNVKAQSDMAVANEARAETGDTIETMAQGQRISLIEPAIPPTNPARPNRKLVAGGAVIAGLLLGLGLVAIMEFMQSGIRRPAEITAQLGISVFATLPYLKTAREIRRRRWWQAMTVAVVVGGLAVIVWGVVNHTVQLAPMLDQIFKHISQTGGALPGSA